MPLEVCAASIHSALNAETAGADRIELCSELSVGGITPSYGFLKEALNKLSIPVYVLIRPRGGDFIYSDEEFEIMKEDIRICKETGAAGIVSGVLNPDNTVDVERTKELIEYSRPLEFTFHRAFDRVSDPVKALDLLIELGVERILTSGQKPSAVDGLDLLKKLKERANGRLIILPGGGVRPDNAKIFKENGFEEIHSSAVLPDDDGRFISDLDSIRKMVNMMKK